MKYFFQLCITTLFFLLLCSTTHAATPEQVCQVRKNTEAARFVACRHKVLSGLPESRFARSITHCRRKLNRGWRRANKRIAKLETSCLDAPLGLKDFRAALRANVHSITTQLGKNRRGIAPKRRCRSLKTVATGRYTACRYRAEARLARSSDTTAYEARISRCKTNLERSWRRIIERTATHDTTCFDDHLTVDDYRSEIETHTDKVAEVLAGEDELDPLALSVNGSPLALTAGGEAKSLTITNRSTKATAFDISADFTGTALEGEVVETGNTCSNVAPGASCMLSFTPGSELVSNTEFTIAGTNTDSVSASIAVVSPTTAPISVAGSPLSITVDGSTGDLTVTNTSEFVTALDIESDFSGTALEGNILETGNTCSSVAPGADCTLTFTSGDTVLAATQFTILGSNTEPVSASVQIVAPAIATLSVDGSPLTLTANGPTGNLIVTNTSATTALDIASDFTGTALDGNVVETGNTCNNVAPAASCTLTFTPGGTLVAATNFSVQGSNTVELTPSIAIQSGTTLTAVNPNSGSAAGGTGITLTGTGFTGATAVTFDGIPATSVNVVNSTTVTAVTPAHAAGVVDVVIDTPAGGATLLNSYTYLATAVGQSSGGGTIACLNGGFNNLIAASADNSAGIEWGGLGTAVGAGAQSNTDGASNTTAIVDELGNNGGVPYAAQLCNDYEVDSQANTPCEVGNTCYDDWFLPAGNNVTASGQLNCLYTNQVAIGGFAAVDYYSSTESSASFSWFQDFDDGGQFLNSKNGELRVRCVRSFTP